MRQVWKISSISRKAELLISKPSSAKPKTLKPFQNPSSPKPTNPFKFIIRTFSSTHPSLPPPPSCTSGSFNSLIRMFEVGEKKVTVKILGLKDELIKSNGDREAIHRILEDKGLPLFMRFSDGYGVIELMRVLFSFPHLAVEVFNWRRKHEGFNFPITSEEYSKGIIAAGRTRNVDLAVELFTEAANNNVKASSTYNALMSVYMSNDLPQKCQSLFKKFKMDGTCIPTITTYNILISVFGRLMLVDHMEETLRQIYASNLSPNVTTFNNLIAGYITAWMWDDMEKAFKTMEMASIEPDIDTYMLMLRGYSYSGDLRKMELIYELLNREDVIRDNLPLIRTMICAYCKSSRANRVEKIEALMKMIPKEEYSPWINVLLIKVYAQEQLLDRMEKFIDIAFENHTAVTNSSIMCEIITVYYRLNAVDKLASFVERAERAGWRLCRSLYHCKMVMYKSQNRLEEMENVLAEMERCNIFSQTKKTLVILCEAYMKFGPRCKLEQVAGLMCKRGYGIPMEYCPS